MPDANKQIGSDPGENRLASEAIMQKTAFVGLDVHKRTIRVSMMDADGHELANGGIQNTPKQVEYT